jgi:rhodanese-related sulfurtransferase
MKNTISIKENVPTLQVEDPSSLNEYTLIDVRRPEEFTGELGHIEGSKLVTLGPDLENYLQVTPRETKILFICRSGARSAHSTLYAQSIGFKNVFNMEGGMIYWNQKNFPITKE